MVEGVEGVEGNGMRLKEKGGDGMRVRVRVRVREGRVRSRCFLLLVALRTSGGHPQSLGR